MARYRESYTLYTRKTVSGKTVYYYRTYTPDGKRTCGKSTGCINKSAARQYCENLLKSGKLYDGSAKKFGEFAVGFFDNGSIWHTEKTKMQKGIKQVSQSYISNQQYLLKNHILPYFENTKLEDFKSGIIKKFRIDLSEKKLSIKTINLITACLKTVLSSALEDNLITVDPFRSIKPLYEEKHKREAFTLDEVKFLIQNSEGDVQLFFLTATLTGMRRSEIMAIRKETLLEQYIDVKDQLLKGSYQVLKNKYERKVPLPCKLFIMLQSQLVERQSLFSFNVNYYNKQVQKICAHFKDKEKRNLCLHSFRHFFNTYLLSENVSPAKVAAVIGHSSGHGSMQELYTTWKPELMPEVYVAQEKLLSILLDS